MAYTKNHYVTDWVEKCRALLCPDEVVWIDGTKHSSRACAAKRMSPASS